MLNLIFFLAPFSHSSMSFNKDVALRLRQYIFRVLLPFDVTVINFSSVFLEQKAMSSSISSMKESILT